MESMHETWTEPTTVTEAEQRATLLWEEIQSIQLQLGDPNRLNENKQRMPWEEYSAWKHKAKYALAMKTREYRRLKKWIKENRIETVQPSVEYLELLDLLEECRVKGMSEVTLKLGSGDLITAWDKVLKIITTTFPRTE